MKKLVILALALVAVFTFASCGEDVEIDYTDSWMKFKVDGTTDYTFGGTEQCAATISGNNLRLRAVSPQNDVFTITINLTDATAPYDGTYTNCSATLFLTGTTYMGTINAVSLEAIPDTAGEFVTGSFTSGTVSQVSINKPLSAGQIHLVLVK
ncbi:MAG: hypothetical protein LBC99_02670 [Spirochaetota bacterium]|jgi:hypothetical protein|nr:hypothetical protein [Spirochaetota bacterium]